MADSVESMLERHRTETQERIDELRPAYEEYETLVAYRDNLPGARARKSASASGRTRSGVDRAAQFLAYIKENPGATVSDAAKNIEGASTNYLYRVRDKLVQAGEIVKDGDGFKVAEPETGGNGRGGRKQEPVAA